MKISEYNKMLELVSHYSKRIHSWITKRSGCVEEVGKNSYFSPTSKTVVLRGEADKFTKGHEYSHAFWHNLTSSNSVEETEFLEYVFLFGDLSPEEMREELSEMGRRKDLIPFTDFLSSMIEVPDGWYKHPKEYWDGFNDRLKIAKNEAFASVFGYLYGGNVLAFEKMQKYFPKFIDSCLNLIEKGLLT